MPRRSGEVPAATFLDVPDGHGGLRRVVRLDPATAGEYARLVGRVLPAVERRLGAGVRANRAVVGPAGGAQLRRWEPARLGWRRSIRAILAAGRPPSLVVADVKDCYRAIGPGAVIRGLRAAGCRPADVDAIVAFLHRSASWGLRGLPVGPDPSAVLANAALLPVDRSLRGLVSLRWVDDLVVVAPTAAEAPSVLRAIREAAAEAGLELNESKTAILGDPAEAALALLGRSPSRVKGWAKG